MKNLLLLMALVLGAYYFYMHPRVETVTEPIAMEAPAPVVAPAKLYFHSPLDAPAMSTGASTGMGYYSTDPNSRFNGYQGGSYSSFQAAGGYPVYSGGVTNNHVTFNNYGTRSGASNSSASSGSSSIAGHVPYGAGSSRNTDSQRTNY